MSLVTRLRSLCAALLITVPASALIVEPISDSAVDCDLPSVAQSPEQSTLVAWQDADRQIWTRGLPTFAAGGEVLAPDAQHHGEGSAAKVVWTWRGLMLVWTTGSRICFNFAYGTQFLDPPHVIETGYDLTYAGLDVYGIAEPGWDVAWIAFEGADAGRQHSVLLLRIRKNDGGDVTVIAADVDGPAAPQVTAVPGWPQPSPRVYFLRDGSTLVYRSEAPGGGWSPEEVVPFPYLYGPPFDVAADAAGDQCVLSLGPQPTCPCNVIHATRQDAEGIWSGPHQLTVPVCYFDWPRSPVIRIDAQGRVHAFWLQRGANELMELVRCDLEYWVWNANGWTDRGGDLDGHASIGLGDHVAMDLTATGQPVFAWSFVDTVAGVPQPRQIMLARPDSPVAAQDAPTSLALTTLEAWPNPFNPHLYLAGQLRSGECATLAVYDPAGRRVASVDVHGAADGRFTTRWDGLDRAGRAVPSGVYIVRLQSETGAAARRVVLAR